MTLNEIKRVLAERGLAPQRRFGQNFLHDRNICDWIARHALDLDTPQTHLPATTPGSGMASSSPATTETISASPPAAEFYATGSDLSATLHATQPRHIWEIGPGLGALTSALLQAGATVSAIEIDRGFIPFLLERFAPEIQNSRFTLHEGDAMDLAPALFPADAHLVSNLPYNIATPLLLELACGPRPPLCIIATVQMEAAERFIAQPGHRTYNAVSVLLQTLYYPGPLKKLPHQVFYPVPEVTSAIITLNRRAPLPDTLQTSTQRAAFSALLRAAFSAKRKRAVAALSQTPPALPGLTAPGSRSDWEQLFQEAEIDPGLRAEQISPLQWLHLFTVIQQKSSPHS